MNKKTSIFCLIVLLFVSFLFCSYFESHYTREVKVCRVEQDIIIFTDTQGNFWEWEKKENGDSFIMGESVKLKMFNNYTINESTDDVITKVVKMNIDK